MNIIQIISEWKKNPRINPIKQGYKRVEAIVDSESGPVTRHIDIKK